MTATKKEKSEVMPCWKVVQKTRGLVRKIKWCQITSGLPTRMSEKSFRRQCSVHQDRARREAQPKHGAGMVRVEWCLECKGKVLPLGLEFADLSACGMPAERNQAAGKTKLPEKTKKKEFVLFNTVRKTKGDMIMKKCDLCGVEGKKKLDQQPDGMLVCASCKPILVAARNRPHAVVAAAEKYKLIPMAELCETVSPFSEEALRVANSNKKISIEDRLRRLEDLARRIHELSGACADLESVRVSLCESA